MPSSATIQQKIAALYVGFFKRAPDNSGLSYWVNQAQTGGYGDDLTLLKAISAGFAQHPQFALDYGQLDNAGFVNKLYENMLGGTGDQDGINYWIGELNQGVSRSNLVAQFINGAMLVDIEAYARDYHFTEEQKAQTYVKQNTLLNKASVAVEFASQLGSITNIDQSQYADLAFSPAYQASQAILQGVTDQFNTVQQKQAYIQTIKPMANPVQSILQEFRYLLTVDAPQVTEGNDGSKMLTFTLQLSRAPTSELAIDYQILNTSTATLGQDYQAENGVVRFQPGESNKTLSFVLNGDQQFETDEQIHIQFSGAGLALPVQAIGTIVNDDLDPNNLPQTFQLTTANDNFTGAGGNDNFNATLSAINANNQLATADILNGAGGIDTLNLTIESIPTNYAANNVQPSISGIEKAVIQIADTAVNNGVQNASLNLAAINEFTLSGDLAKLQQGNSYNPYLQIGYNNVLQPTLNLHNATGNMSFDNAFYANGTSAQPNQSVNLHGFTGALTLDDGVKQLDLTITEALAQATVNFWYSYNSQLTIVGDQNAILATNAASVDASDYSSSLQLAANSATSVTLGSSNDWLMGSMQNEFSYNNFTPTQMNLTANHQLDGGEGRDVLVAAVNQVTAEKTQGIRNFELLMLTGGGTANLGLLPEIDTILLDNNGSDISLTGVSDQLFRLFGGYHRLTLTPQQDTMQDSLALTLEQTDSNTRLTANSHEIIQITSQGEQQNSLVLTATSLQQLLLQGNQALNLINSLASVSVDAQQNTGGITLKAVAGLLDFIGSSANDSVNMFATLESGDRLQGGEGVDTLIISDLRTVNADTITQIAGFEIVELQGNNAAFDASVWTGDTIQINNGSTSAVDQLKAEQTINVKHAATVNVTTMQADQVAYITSQDTSWSLILNNTANAQIELSGNQDQKIVLKNVVSASNTANIIFTESPAQTTQHTLALSQGWGEEEPEAYFIDATTLSWGVNGFQSRNIMTSETWLTGSGKDNLKVFAGGDDYIDAGSGDDVLTYSKSNNSISAAAEATLVGGEGNDTFIINNSYSYYHGKLIIADLNLGTASTALDKLSIDRLDASALTNSQILKYTGAEDMNGKKVIVLNDGQTYTAQTAEAKLQGYGFGTSTKTALVFYADSEQKVHLAYDGNTASAVGNSAINDLAILEGLTIGQVATNLSHLDFV